MKDYSTFVSNWNEIKHQYPTLENANEILDLLDKLKKEHSKWHNMDRKVRKHIIGVLELAIEENCEEL